MTDSNGSEKPIVPAQTSAEPVVSPVATQADDGVNPVETISQSASTDSPAQAEQSEATTVALSNLEQQLGQLNAHILAMQQQLNESASEPSAETEEARGTLSALKAAASEVQSTIAEVKNNRRPASAAALMQLSARIGGLITEATEESTELGSAVSESRSHTAHQAEVARKASSKSSAPKLVQRINAAITGSNTSRNSAVGRTDDEDDNAERYIVTGKGRDAQRKARKVRGQGVDRDIVEGLTTIGIREDIADEIVWGGQSAGRKTVVGLATVTSGAGEILTGDVEGAKKSARATSRGLRRTLDRFIGDENAEAAAHMAGDILETAGVAGATVVSTAKDNLAAAGDAAKSLYQSGVNLIWGEPPPKAKPKAAAPSMRGKIVTLDGFGNITIEAARAKLQEKGVKIDANGNGVTTYGECLAAIARWNETHHANGQLLKPAPRR